MEENKQTLDANNYIINITDVIPEPEPIVSIDDIPVFTRGNISIIGGKQKSKKTFFVCMPVVSTLIGEYYKFTSPTNAKSKVLFFDCEQSKSHVQIVLDRIYRMAKRNTDEPDDNLIIYSLRELMVRDRQELIKQAIERHKPDFVVIDGLVDICEDFNAIDKSTEAIQLLMTLSSKYNCHITSVLHENKGDGNLRGHLGTIGTQKAETVIHLDREGDTTKVEGKDTRNKGFNNFNFAVCQKGLPFIINAPNRVDKGLQEIKEAMKHICKANKCMRYEVFVNEYAEHRGLSPSTAKKHIAKAIENEFIEKDNGLYYFKS